MISRILSVLALGWLTMPASALQASPLVSFFFDNTETTERVYRRASSCEIHLDKIIIRNKAGGIEVARELPFTLASADLDQLRALILKVAATPLEQVGGVDQKFFAIWKATVQRTSDTGETIEQEIILRESRNQYLAARRSADVGDLNVFTRETCMMHGFVGNMNHLM